MPITLGLVMTEEPRRGDPSAPERKADRSPKPARGVPTGGLHSHQFLLLCVGLEVNLTSLHTNHMQK